MSLESTKHAFSFHKCASSFQENTTFGVLNNTPVAMTKTRCQLEYKVRFYTSQNKPSSLAKHAFSVHKNTPAACTKHASNVPEIL